MYRVHTVYGWLMVLLGLSAFVFPPTVANIMGLPCASLPSLDAVIVQTAGLIFFVLGSYRSAGAAWARCATSAALASRALIAPPPSFSRPKASRPCPWHGQSFTFS